MRRSYASEELSTLFFWTLIHSFSVWLLGMIALRMGVTDAFAKILLMGVGITIIAKIARMLMFRKQIVIDFGLAYWVVLHGFAFWVMTFVVGALAISNVWIATLVMGAGIALIARISRKTRIGSQK